MRKATLFAAMFLLPALPALAQTQNTQSSSQSSSGATSPAAKADKAAMAKMHQQMMDAPLSGNADQDFAAEMIPHHEGAVAMAKVELQYGHSPELRRMAEDIIKSQDRQIGELRQWQKDHPQH